MANTDSGDNSMEKSTYVMLIKRGKTYNKINKTMVVKHVEHIKQLDDDGKLVLCGATKGYPGIAGMIIFTAESYEAADEICKSEPFVAEGYATYMLFSMRVGNRENNYLGTSPDERAVIYFKARYINEKQVHPSFKNFGGEIQADCEALCA